MTFYNKVITKVNSSSNKHMLVFWSNLLQIAIAILNLVVTKNCRFEAPLATYYAIDKNNIARLIASYSPLY